MAIAVLAFMLLLQLPRIFGFGDLLQSKDCGANWVAYSYSHGQELFYINGNVVSKVTFCKTLQLYMVNGCDAKYYFGSTSCGLEVSFGRKLLQKDISNNPTSPGHKNVSKPLSASKVGIAASGVLFVCCVFLCPCFYGKKEKATAHAGLSKDPNSMDSASSLEGNSASEKTQGSLHRVPPSPSRFSVSPKLSRLESIHLNLSQVIKATHNFSNKLQIGEGGFGTVYKAQLEGDQVVAVKRAKREQFENLKTEFSRKAELLAKIDHRNLVKLLGYIDQGNERLLIAEYVPNGTLREHLDGLRGRILDFNRRLEIAIDVGHGLTYLHRYAEKPIIHRDVRSSNILLTESMRAKVADFGFARLGPMDSNQTHISTKVKGTVGYLDPEYMRTYQLTPKSDVYSFGILLIEIVTGRRPVEVKKPVEERVTLRWAFRKYTEGNVAEMADPLMEEGINGEVLMKMIGLAIQCAAPSRADRPDMKSVGEQLWTIRANSSRVQRKYNY